MQRRSLLIHAAGPAALLAAPALAIAQSALAPMTEGPFYPARAWRERWTDWDADLTRVQRAGAGEHSAQGEHLGLQTDVRDTRGRAIDGAEVEIWQCDALGAYRHPGVPLEPGGFDAAFQGFGAARSTADGTARLRTIKPVPYPGRAPHIHVKVRHASFGELTTQLFVAGDPRNERDGLWRRLDPAQRDALAMRPVAATAESGLRWAVRHALVVPA